MNSMIGLQRLACALLAVSLILSVGCDAHPTGQVSGQVMYNGSPVTDCVINLFLKEKGAGATATLDSSGKFTFPDPLELGTYIVFITPTPPVAGAPGTKPTKPTTPRIPKKTSDASTSDTKLVVKAGKNDVVIELKD